MPENQQGRLNRLKEIWKVTKQHFEAARALLPSPLTEFPESECGSLKGFEEYLAYNELGLALDELAGLGEANQCPAAYWHELAAAAENMELTEQADYYRQKATRTKLTLVEQGIAADCLQLRSFLTPLPAAAEFGR